MLKTNLKKAASSTGNFIQNHKVGIAVTAAVIGTTIASRWVHGSVVKAHEEFLKEKGLFEEFVTTYFQDPTDI